METLALEMKANSKSTPTDHSLEYALGMAEALVKEIIPFVDSVTIAGSIRRRCSRVKDIDLVCVAAEPMKLYQHIVEQGYKMTTNVHEAEHYWRFIFHDISVDLFWARPETEAVVLLFRTGPKHHNIHLVNLAKLQGKRLSPNLGVFSAKGVLLPAQTEADIYRQLGMVYRRCTEREGVGRRDY